MLNIIKAIAFIKKDLIIESGYKIAFLTGLVNSVLPLVSYFFISKLVGNDSAFISKYGGNYFTYTLIGLAFTSYFIIAVGTFSSTMRRSQMAGCLEAILSSQTSTTAVVLMSSLYSFISSALQLFMMFLVAIAFFNFDVSHVNVLSAITVFAVSLIIFISLGIFSAAGTILFKQGEPFGWIFGVLSSLVGGAFYPVEIMPQWLQKISFVVPITHSLDALRLAILQDHSIGMLSGKILSLVLMGLLLLPLSLAFFNWAVAKGKKDGSLMQY